MKLVGHQPEFLPWLGFWHKMTLGDAFMLMDDVQYQKNYFLNRNRLRSKDGFVWMQVPVRTRGRSKQAINEALIANDEPWRRKLLAALECSYRRAPYFDVYYPILQDILGVRWERMSELSIALIRQVMVWLDIKVPLYRSSDFAVAGQGTARLISMCRAAGARCFIGGRSGRDYVDLGRFAEEGLEIEFQEFVHPHYQQVHGGFEPGMSIVDLLFNHGPASRAIIAGAAVTADV